MKNIRKNKGFDDTNIENEFYESIKKYKEAKKNNESLEIPDFLLPKNKRKNKATKK